MCRSYSRATRYGARPAEVVEPTADISQVKAKLTMPVLAQPSVVEPPLSADQLKLKARRDEYGAADATGRCAEASGRAAARRSERATRRAANGAGKGVPAQPSLQGLQSSKGQGQIIALSLNPADVRGPVELPSGNRSGEFHASPGGKADAPGTPSVAGNPGATGSGAGGGKGPGSGNGGNGTAPPGITRRCCTAGRAGGGCDRHTGKVAQRCAEGREQEAHRGSDASKYPEREPSAGRDATSHNVRYRCGRH